MPEEVQVKNYRITLMKKPHTSKIQFSVDVRAVSQDAAIEKAYSRIGSKHRVPRQLLIVQQVKEIDSLDLKDPILREIAGNDQIKI